MSFLTEYFDEFRQHPLRKAKVCRPEDRWKLLEGKWLDPKKDVKEKAWSEEEIQKFIYETMKSLRGQSTYFNSYCAHLDQEFKTRPFVPRKKKLRPCIETEQPVKEKVVEHSPAPKLALKDTEVMKTAKQIYERDLDRPTLRPLPTHFRILGYARPRLFKTGISDYQDGIARLAYELVRDDRLPRFHAETGGRAKWGYPPEQPRQPELDIVPYDGERLY